MLGKAQLFDDVIADIQSAAELWRHDPGVASWLIIDVREARTHILRRVSVIGLVR